MSEAWEAARVRWARDNVNDASGRASAIKSKAHPWMSPTSAQRQSRYPPPCGSRGFGTIIPSSCSLHRPPCWSGRWETTPLGHGIVSGGGRRWENEVAASVYSLPGILTSLQALVGSMTPLCLCTQRRDAPRVTGVTLLARG